MFGRMRRKRELKSRLFGDMMLRFGLSEHGNFSPFEDKMLRTAAARCTHCEETARCRAWLAESNSAEEAFEFCPNASTFTMLANRAPAWLNE